MVTKGGVWFVVLAFVLFVISPDFAHAEAVPSAADAAMTAGIAISLSEDNGAIAGGKETFSVRESLQLAQAGVAQDTVRAEATNTRTEDSESAAGNGPKREGLSAGATVAIVIVGVALVALAVAAAAAGSRGSGHVSGLNLNFGK